MFFSRFSSSKLIHLIIADNVLSHFGISTLLNIRETIDWLKPIGVVEISLISRAILDCFGASSPFLYSITVLKLLMILVSSFEKILFFFGCYCSYKSSV